MYNRLSKCLPPGPKAGNVLSISHSLPLCEILGLTGDYLEANFPEVNMMALPYADETFDYVVSDQVLEHIQGSPQLAIEESHRVLKPGGVAVHTTVFMYPIHGYPHDYWRFTPANLKQLCEKFSQIIEVGYWGNPAALQLINLGLGYDGVPKLKWHPFHKAATRIERDWPIMVWIVAKK